MSVLFRKSKKSGFSLPEITIIILIIVLLTGIVTVALMDSRTHSQDTARIAQVKEYQKAFDLYYSDTGHYPMLGRGATASVCLGDYDDNACWQNGSSVTETTTISDAIVPQYMSKIPPAETFLFGKGSGTTYEGMVYTHKDFGKSYNILYFMSGNDKFCIIDGTSASNIGDDTLCTLVVTP